MNRIDKLETHMLGDLVSVCLSCLAEHGFLLATKVTNKELCDKQGSITLLLLRPRSMRV